MTQQSSPGQDEFSEERYIIYRVGQEHFASSLLSIKEIVDPMPYSPVPNDHDYFLGLANLRGQIIGVIDIGLRFGFPSSRDQDEGVLLIFEEDGAILGALVSGVESAISINPNEIIAEQSVPNCVPEQAYLGVVRYKERILPLISLVKLLHIPENDTRIGA